MVAKRKKDTGVVDEKVVKREERPKEAKEPKRHRTLDDVKRERGELV